MKDREGIRVSRRRMLSALGAASAIGLAGCSENNDNNKSSNIPKKKEGIEEWGKRLNEHAKKANIDWDQFKDDDLTIKLGMGLHPYSTTTEAVKSYFEDLTGITVKYQKFTEDQFWLEAENALKKNKDFDAMMVGLWPAGGYHGLRTSGRGVRDLKPFINNATLTDKDWLHLDDFRDDTKQLMTFPDKGGGSSFVGFPNGIEAYGCVGYDKPTFETLGLAEPTTLPELKDAAKQIAESDKVDRGGIVSRTSSTVLSSANWGTMFKTYGGNWIDRQAKEGRINSERGVASLELFGEMLNNYGPSNPGTYDWYANNTAFSNGDVAMIYSTPQTSGIVDREQMKRTKWLPPLKGPNGEEPVVDTWIWATGIAQQTTEKKAKAAWLYIQWANSREANYMLSTKQWKKDQPRAGYARMDYVDEQLKKRDDPPVPGEGYMNAFREGMNNVPVDPPPVPVDTTENMDIMGEAAKAMSSVVSGSTTAQDALDAANPEITKHAKEIPDRYITRNPVNNIGI